MRKVIAIFLAAAALCAGAYARAEAAQAKTKPQVCQSEADKEIAAYNSELYDRALEQAKIELEPGDEINMDALPSEPYLEQIDGLDFIYGWGEQEECACGATVKTQPSQDGKSCKAEVDRESYSCECG